jgi:hypothetical protein
MPNVGYYPDHTHVTLHSPLRRPVPETDMLPTVLVSDNPHRTFLRFLLGLLEAFNFEFIHSLGSRPSGPSSLCRVAD